jgi:hypothetical protein
MCSYLWYLLLKYILWYCLYSTLSPVVNKINEKYCSTQTRSKDHVCKDMWLKNVTNTFKKINKYFVEELWNYGISKSHLWYLCLLQYWRICIDRQHSFNNNNIYYFLVTNNMQCTCTCDRLSATFVTKQLPKYN